MEQNYSLADIAAATGEGLGGNNLWVLIILFAMIFGGNGLFGNRGDYGQFATAASQQEILFGQRFSNLDNKMDRLGNGIADATYAVTNNITNEGRNIQMLLADHNCTTQRNIDSVRFDMSNYANAINQNIDAKFASLEKNQLQAQVSAQAQQIQKLELQSAMCGVVRYPNAWTYNAGQSPFCQCNNGCNGCGNI